MHSYIFFFLHPLLYIAYKLTKKYLHKIRTDTLFVGKSIIFMPKCHSTNDEASKLLTNGTVEEGTIIYTNHQQKGRGQRGTEWASSPEMNLTFSVILFTGFLPVDRQFYLTMAVSLALIDSLIPLLPEGLKIKWPNDIYHNFAKLGGILIENVVQHNALKSSVIGIGLNVNQTSFNTLPNATSMATVSRRFFVLEDVFRAILQNLEYRYLMLKRLQMERLQADYHENLLGWRQSLPFKSDQNFTGIVHGVSVDGKLMVDSGGSLKSFGLKEIEFLLPDTE